MALMMFGVLWLSWLIQVQGEMVWIDGILMRKEGQHGGFPFEISCPGNDVIEIFSTRYGVPNNQNGQPYETVNRTSCYLPGAKDIVTRRCNNRTRCGFDITSEIFSDPCPGLSKYLEVIYNCVKFLFKCPGRLSGIGQPVVHNVQVLPEDGSWTRDPLMYPERVYFTKSGSILQEYWSLADFVNGNPKKTYEISPRMTPTSAVVYDRDLYYVKENSRHIVRFSLITQTRTKEFSVPPGRNKNKNTKISVHADETGLWITYDNKDGKMVASKLSESSLTPKRSWITSLRAERTSYVFIICGTMYSVSSTTGLVDYSYDTTTHQNPEQFNLSTRIHDQRPRPFSRSRQRARATFFSFNASSSAYNPRDRKLYLWDRTRNQAITMKLRFDPNFIDRNASESPQNEGSTTKTTRTNPTPISKNRRTSKCHSIERKGMMWEEITAGEIAHQKCYDGTGGWATWRCVKLGSEGQAEWAKEGPNMPDCIDWINEIAANYHRDKTNLLFTLESLQHESSQRFREIESKQLKVLMKFTKQVLQNAFPVNQTSASQIVRATVATMSMLVDNKAVWYLIDGKTKASLVHDIIETAETAASLFINGPGNNKLKIENTAVSSKNILFQVQSWERTPWDANYQLKTKFPDETFCSANYLANCDSDVIELPDMTVTRGKSKAGLSYTIYRGMASILDGLTPDRQLDSNIASVTSKRSANLESRSSPTVQVTLRHISIFSGTRYCAKWIYTDATKLWTWSSGSCTVVTRNLSHTSCKCSGYGKYALVWDPASNEPYSTLPEDTETDAEALEIITSAGSAVAIICFLACAATLLILRDLAGDIYTIRKNMTICTFMAEVTFLVGINQTSHRIGCAIVAGVLQYSLLAIFTWMILEAVQLYKMLMDMFDDESRWKVYYAAGYGVPTVVVAVSVGIGFKDYGTPDACFINPISGVMLLPVISILTAIVTTVGILCAAIYKICTASVTFTSCRMISDIRASVKMSFAILFLQLMTWIVAISWTNERSTLLAVLFCLFNSALGMGAFICYCVLSKEIRKRYKSLFDRIGCSRTNSKDSYLEKSSTFQRSYTPARYTSSDTTNGVTTGSLGGHQCSPWEVEFPQTFLSSPETEMMTPFDTRVSRSLSKELSKMRGVTLRDRRNNSASSILYFYSTDKPSQRGRSKTSTEPRKRKRRSSSAPNRRHTIIIPDRASLGQRLTRTPNTQEMHAQYATRPDSHDPETTLLSRHFDGPTRNLSDAASNISPYGDRHRHRHSECFHQIRSLENESGIHHKKYRTGLPTAPRRYQQKSRTMTQQYSTSTNPYRARTSNSRLIIRNNDRHEFTRGNDNDHVTSPTCPLPNPHLRYNVTPSQDGAIYARSTNHRLPPNSIIQRLRDEMLPPDDGVRFIQIKDHRSSQLATQAIQMPTLSSRIRTRKKSHNKNENNTSDDEGQGSSVESEHNTNLNCHRDVIRSQGAYEETPLYSNRAKFRRQQAVVTSDPDDAIVTDYSGEDNESPIARRYPQWSNQELLV